MAEITTSQIGNGTTAYGSEIVVKDLDLDVSNRVKDDTPVPLANLIVSVVGSLLTKLKLAPPVVALALILYVLPTVEAGAKLTVPAPSVTRTCPLTPSATGNV